MITSEINEMLMNENITLKILSILKNEESSQGNVYIVYTTTKRYVIKNYINLSHTELIIDIHNLLEKTISIAQ